MAEWRVGRSLGRTLYRDGQLVGLVDTAEIAAEIVEALNAVRDVCGCCPKPAPRTDWGAQRESGRERSLAEAITAEQIEVQRRSRLPRLLHDPYDAAKGGGVEAVADVPTASDACRFCGHGAEHHARSVGGGLMACARCPLGLCGEHR